MSDTGVPKGPNPNLSFFRPGGPRPVNNWLLVAAIFLLIAAIAAENPIFVQLTTNGAHEGSEVFSLRWLIHLLMEMGFAFFIAWMVTNGVEAASRARDELRAQQMRAEISKDVLGAVLSISHDPAYVQTVLDVNLRAELMRELIDVGYIIKPLTAAQEAEVDADPGRFVLLKMLTKYKFRNVGPTTRSFTLKYRYAVRSGKLRDIARISALEVKPEGKSKVEYSQTEIDAQTRDDGHFYRVCEWDVVLQPRGAVDVLIENALVKELSDSEVFGTLHPTMKLALTVRSEVPGLRLGVRALTATALENPHLSSDGLYGEWAINGPILPNDSVIVWWRTEEDDGAPVLALPAPTPTPSTDEAQKAQGAPEASQASGNGVPPLLPPPPA